MTEIITNDTVTKNELSEALFDQVGLNKREAKDMKQLVQAVIQKQDK